MKRLASILASAIFLSTFLLGNIPSSHAYAATNYEAQSFNAQVMGREGGNAEISVTTWLPNAETSTADTVFASEGYSNSNTSILAVNSTPTIITDNGQTFANYRMSIPESSFLSLYNGATYNNVGTYKYGYLYIYLSSMIHPAVGSTWSTVNPSWSTSPGWVNSYQVIFYGAPTVVGFRPVSPDPFANAIVGAQTYSVSLFDSNGARTLMLPGQSLTLGATSNLSLQATPGTQSITSGNQSGSIASTDLNSKLSYSIQGTRSVVSQSTISISASGAWAALTPTSFTLPSSQSPITKPIVGGYAYLYGSGPSYALAGGSDGKLYIWGGSSNYSVNTLQQSSINVSGYGNYFTQPQNLSIPSGCLVKQLIGSTILDSCGYLWNLSNKINPTNSFTNYFGNSLASVALSPTNSSLNLSNIIQISDGGQYGLTADRRVINPSSGASVDLTAMGSESATVINYSGDSGTLFILGTQGHLYSALGNGSGTAGRNTTAGTVTLGKIIFPGQPDTVTVTSIATLSGAAVATMSDGTLWGWGSNTNGIAGKDPTQITQLNSPSLIPLPSGVIPQNVTSEYSLNGSFILYAMTQSSSTRGWTFNSGNFSQLTNSAAGYPIVQYIYSSNGYFTVDSLGDVYSNINGNCGDPSATYPYRISSIGQFGPAYSYDNLVISSVFMQEGSQVQAVVGNSVNQIAGHTFSLQFSGVHTRCYTSPSQLTISWDLSGNGSYTTPAVLTTSTTGYQVYQTSLSYPSAGRYKVGLQVTTPAGNIYTSVVTIGVDGTSSSTFSLSETRTVVVSSSSTHNLAVGSDGKIYAWGNNTCEQLGIAWSSYTSLDIPTQVQLSDSSTISTITAGYNTSYAIDSAGKVFAWGSSPGPNGLYSGVTPTLITELASTPVLDVTALTSSYFGCTAADISSDVAGNYNNSNIGVVAALTSTGKLLQWSHATSVSAVPGSGGVVFRQIVSSYSSLYALDSSGNVWRWSPGSAISQVNSISGVSKIRGGATVIVAILSNGQIAAESGNGDFGQISFPQGITITDAQPLLGGSSVLAVSATGNLFQTYISYNSVGGVSTLTNSTWVPISQGVSVGSSDYPLTQPKSDTYISFTSNRVSAISAYNGYSNFSGNCRLSSYIYQNNQNIYYNRVISQGQFGDAYNPDTINVGSLTATVGSGSASAISRGGLIAAAAGTSVVLRAQNLSSQCYGSNLTISADSTNSGTFTNIPLSNESGTLNYIVNATVPTSGRLPVVIKAQALSGLSLSFTINLASFSSTPSSNITSRTNPMMTNSNFGVGVGSDGYAYGWANNKRFNFLLNSSPPFSSYSPTKVILPGSAHVADIAATYSGNEFGVLAVDTSGKTWTWSTNRNADLPMTTFTSGNTPTSPTLVPGLSGINIKRISVSDNGSIMAALSNTGVVYIWNSIYRTPTPINSLAGLDIVDIHVSNYQIYALTSSGELYTNYAYNVYSGWDTSLRPSSCNNSTLGSLASLDLSDLSQACLWIQKVSISDPVKSFSAYTGTSIGMYGTLAVTTTGKLYFFGRYGNSDSLLPRLVTLPNNLSASIVGGVVPSNNGSYYPPVVASDGTWLSLVALPDGSLNLLTASSIVTGFTSQLTGLIGASEGNGFGFRLSSGKLFTFNQTSVQGSCAINQPWISQVMSDGQFGASYHADSVNISASGPSIFRPGVPTPISLTAYSVCNGGAGITFDHQVLGESAFSGPMSGTVSYDQSSSSATFLYSATTAGQNWITFRATTAQGITGTYQFEADVTPAPPAGLLGISINNGDRYTNSRNVTIRMVWPDGTLVAYVSNDGGFVPGTYSQVPIQSQVSWVLPPQAAVPLPAIVYARFGNSNATTYFDDIILDSNPPILTFASATPNP